MDDGEWLALWGSWWLWRDTVITAAVCRARSVFWRARVRQALRQNRTLNLFPSTQQALSYALERDVGTIQRAVSHPDNAFPSVASVTQVIRNAVQILGPILETRRQ